MTLRTFSGSQKLVEIAPHFDMFFSSGNVENLREDGNGNLYQFTGSSSGFEVPKSTEIEIGVTTSVSYPSVANLGLGDRASEDTIFIQPQLDSNGDVWRFELRLSGSTATRFIMPTPVDLSVSGNSFKLSYDGTNVLFDVKLNSVNVEQFSYSAPQMQSILDNRTYCTVSGARITFLETDEQPPSVILNTPITEVAGESTGNVINITSSDVNPTTINSSITLGGQALTITDISGSSSNFDITYSVPVDIMVQYQDGLDFILSVGDDDVKQSNVSFLLPEGKKSVQVTDASAEKGSVFFNHTGVAPVDDSQVRYWTDGSYEVFIDNQGIISIGDEPSTNINIHAECMNPQGELGALGIVAVNFNDVTLSPAIIHTHPQNGNVIEGNQSSVNVFSVTGVNFKSVIWRTQVNGGAWVEHANETATSFAARGDMFSESDSPVSFQLVVTSDDDSVINSNVGLLTVIAQQSVKLTLATENVADGQYYLKLSKDDGAWAYRGNITVLGDTCTVDAWDSIVAGDVVTGHISKPSVDDSYATSIKVTAYNG